MEIAFFISVTLLALVSTWEYFSGKILDIAFTRILAWRQEAQEKFLRIIFIQLAVWIFLLTLMFVTYGILFEAGPIDLRRVRTYLVLIFILIVFPYAMIRKQFATWVKKTTQGKRKKG